MRVTDSNVLWCIANDEDDDDIEMYQEDIAEVIEYENVWSECWLWLSMC